MHKNNKPDNELVPTRTNENARQQGNWAIWPQYLPQNISKD